MAENLLYCRLWTQTLWAETPQINIRPGELRTLQWIEIMLNTIACLLFLESSVQDMKNIATISMGFCFPTLLFNFKRHCTIKFLEEGVSPLRFSVKEERMGEKFEKSLLV